jgi:hypothetical protein
MPNIPLSHNVPKSIASSQHFRLDERASAVYACEMRHLKGGMSYKKKEEMATTAVEKEDVM